MSSKEEGHAALGKMPASQRPAASERPDLSPASSHRILPLSAEAIAQIHSSKHITNLQTVVLALLENSLDARSSQVDISVDWRRGGCSVHDDGIGIPRTEFGDDGGLGRMYCTSKRASVDIRSGSPIAIFRGFSGTFLAELAAMSLLTITSMQTGDHDSSTLALHQGKVITRHMLPLNDPIMPSTCRLHGTNVLVRDLFGNMPVRVKQRVLAGEGGYDKDWHELKRGVVAVLLAWPLPCAVKLRDASGQHKAVNIVGHHPRAASALTKKSLNQLAGKTAKFDMRDNMPMLFHVGLAPQDSVSRWVPLSASTSAFTLKGMICLDPAPTRQCQFLALGISPCGNGSGNNELHDVVNRVFANSSFGVVEERPGTALENGRDNAYTGKRLQAQKGVDRYPMYCMQLAFRTPGQTAGSPAENINDSTLKGLVGILEASVTAWLDSHGFRPRKRRRRWNEEQQSPAVASNSALGPCTTSATQPLSSHRSALETTHEPERIVSAYQSDMQNSRPASKRRKIVDLSTADDCVLSRLRSLQGHEAEPILQSHIRTGRVEGRPQSARGPVFSVSKRISEPGNEKRLRPHTVDSIRSNHVPAASHSTQANAMQVDKPNDLDPKATSARSRNSTSTLRRPSADQTDTASASKHMSMSEPAPTSDDFGGLDDADILQAEEDSGLGAANSPAVPNTEDSGQDDIVTWRDPDSKQSYRVNSRTGVVLPATSSAGNPTSRVSTDGANRQRAGIDTALSSAGKPLSLAKRAAAAAKDGAEEAFTTKEKWLPGFLKEWNNPVFVARKEEPIPLASIDGPGLLENEGQAKCCARGAAGLHTAVQASVHAAGIKLSKAAFQHAKVLAQVDRKFILCRMPASAPVCDTSSLLILIDQHAASERIILEGLFSSLFTIPEVPPTSADPPTLSIKTANLATETSKSTPLRYEISQQEHTLFTQYKPHFALFGIHYTSQPTKPLAHNNTDFHATRSAKQEHRLIVTDLPTVIAERCAKLPPICIDLLRAEVWSLHDRSRNPLSHLPSPEEGDPVWVKILPLLPAKLLAMLQSRSCRSAVMFNDVLSMQQCRHLVKELGECVFPFGCAHGRVSMVPLVDLGMEEERGGGFGSGIGGITRDLRWTRRPREGAGEKKNEEWLVREKEAVCDIRALGAWIKAKEDAAKDHVGEGSG